MKKLREAGGVDAESLQDVVPANRRLLRDLPIYFPIQVTDRCPQACTYCPLPVHAGDVRNNHGFMEVDRFSDICRRIVDFTGDAIISPSLWGESSLHPKIGPLITTALEAGETRVLVETSGIGWDEGLLETLAGTVEPGRLQWIVSLDAAEENLYRSLRGEGFEEAEKFARRLRELFGTQVWVQAVRMNENEEHLEEFHNKWTAEGFTVIIQKYDPVAGFLPERQPADLSPLNRFPCWHLKRDFPILLNGDVPMCREVFGRESSLGNVFVDSLESIWDAGASFHDHHVDGRYPGICETCDEYYTFNF
jgi:spiro-SPASM protein